MTPEMLTAGVMILHNNTQPHVVTAMTELLEKYDWQLLFTPVLQSWHDPSDFELFPKLKKHSRDVYSIHENQ